MENITNSKLATYIGIALVAVYGFYKLVTLIAVQDIFSKLNQDQSFTILITLIILAALICFLVIIIAVFKKQSPNTEEKVEPKVKRRREKRTKKSWKKKLVWGLALLMLLLIGFTILHSASDYPKRLIFKEEFKKESYPKVWRYVKQSEAISILNEGNYVLSAKEKRNISRRINLLDYFGFSLIDNPNYEVRIRIKLLEGDNKGYGVEWGARSKGAIYYGFLINKERQFSIQTFKYNNSVELIKDWEYHNIISITEFNILKIVKYGGVCNFYINEELVAKVSNLKDFGNEVGFNAPAFSTVAIDWIEVSEYLE